MKYHYIKGKNNKQCGIHFHNDANNNCTSLHLLFLNMPRAEYGIDAAKEHDRKNILIFNNHNSNHYRFKIDNQRLYGYDRLFIYDINRSADILFEYDLSALDYLAQEPPTLKNLQPQKDAPPSDDKIKLSNNKPSRLYQEKDAAALEEEIEENNVQAAAQKHHEPLPPNPLKQKISEKVPEEKPKPAEGNQRFIIRRDNQRKQVVIKEQEEVSELNRKFEEAKRKPTKEQPPAGQLLTSALFERYFNPISPFTPPLKNHQWFAPIDDDEQYLVQFYDNVVDYETLYFSANRIKDEEHPARIIGFYSSNHRRVEIDYTVFGVLGEFKPAHQPVRGLTGYVYWQCLYEGSTLGYWVLYLENKSGKIIVPANKKNDKNMPV